MIERGLLFITIPEDGCLAQAIPETCRRRILGVSLDFEESISDCGKRVLFGISFQNYLEFICEYVPLLLGISFQKLCTTSHLLRVNTVLRTRREGMCEFYESLTCHKHITE